MGESQRVSQQSQLIGIGLRLLDEYVLRDTFRNTYRYTVSDYWC